MVNEDVVRRWYLVLPEVYCSCVVLQLGAHGDSLRARTAGHGQDRCLAGCLVIIMVSKNSFF